MSVVKVKSVRAFTLIETIVVLLLASLITVAVLAVYVRARANAMTIMDRLQQNRLQVEILQKIAEDIDRLAAPGFDVIINFRNKLDNEYRSAQLELESSYYGNDDKKKDYKKDTYERIVWRTFYVPDDDALRLYRMHTGLNVENKVLKKNDKSSRDSEWFIPLASGITHFELKAQQGETVLGAWTSETLPKAVRAGISFALPQELADGSIGIPEEDISFRTIAIDRTRRIPYQFVKKKFDLPEEDPNDLLDESDPNALTSPDESEMDMEMDMDPINNEDQPK